MLMSDNVDRESIPFRQTNTHGRSLNDLYMSVDRTI